MFLSVQAAPPVVPIPSFGFANSFGDHMVLQAAPSSAVIWGWGPVGGKVTVTVASTEALQSVVMHCVVDANGRWTTTLPNAINASLAAYTVTASLAGTTSTDVTLTDVLFGDVFICSGQSNMQFTGLLLRYLYIFERIYLY